MTRLTALSVRAADGRVCQRSVGNGLGPWVTSAGALVALAALLTATPVMAQDLRLNPQIPEREPEMGHSADYYGMHSSAERDASIRALLAGYRLDNGVYPAPSLAEASAYLLVRMFSGGGGPPTDIARPRESAEVFLPADAQPDAPVE